MSRPVSTTSVAVAIALALAGTTAVAQSRLTGWVAAAGASVNAHHHWPPVGDSTPSATASGFAVGAIGALTFRRATLEVHYFEGRVERIGPDSGYAFVTGGIGLAVRIVPWFSAHAASRARTYITTAAGDDQWLSWEIGGRVAVPLYRTHVRGDLSLWRALATSLNNRSTGTGQGGAVGLTLEPFARPWWLRMAYDVDQATAGSARRRDVVERLTISVGIGRR
jgi:hypothetical protein